MKKKIEEAELNGLPIIRRSAKIKIVAALLDGNESHSLQRRNRISPQGTRKHGATGQIAPAGERPKKHPAPELLEIARSIGRFLARRDFEASLTAARAQRVKNGSAAASANVREQDEHPANLPDVHH